MIPNILEFLEEEAYDILSDIHNQLETHLSNCSFWHYSDFESDEDYYYYRDRINITILKGVEIECGLEIKLEYEVFVEYLNGERGDTLTGYINIYPASYNEIDINGFFESSFEYVGSKLHVDEFYFSIY